MDIDTLKVLIIRLKNKPAGLKNIRAYSVACMVSAGLYIARELVPASVVILLYPTVSAASLFLGTPAINGPGYSYIIPHGDFCLNIIESCSGYNFWLLLAGCATYLVVSNSGGMRRFLYAAIIMPISLLAAIGINTARVLTAYYAAYYTKDFLSPAYGAILHLWIGILVFMPCLAVSYYFLQRRLTHVAQPVILD